MSKASSTLVRRGGAAPARTRDEALKIAMAALEAMTDEEDAAVTAAALADPDAQPAHELFERRRGRPRSARTKRSVHLRLDNEVVESFQAGGRGWQTRMNAALRKAAGLE